MDSGGVGMTQDAEGGAEPEAPISIVRRSDQPAKKKPTKALPTNRMAFPKQLDVARAYAIASGDTESVVKTTDVASLVGVHTTTVQLVNPFLSDSKLILKAEGGGYTPSPALIAFNQAYAWNRDTAAQKLGPVLADTWYGKALLPKLRLHAMETAEVVGLLAAAASAGPEYKGQLSMILDYMEAGGLIVKEGTMILARDGQAQVATPPEPQAQTGNDQRRDTPKPATVATSFSKDSAEGMVAFNVQVRVNMAEFADWTPDRISSFFNGIAKVLAAKSGIEDTEVNDT
jgi:hypothetical protein